MIDRTDKSHVITLAWRDGRRETVTIPEDTDVVTAAERDGIKLPFGCRTGVCGTCTGRLLAGTLEHGRPPRALKERHREKGYVLPCIATPTSDATVEVGSAVHEDLLENPWESGSQRRTE